MLPFKALTAAHQVDCIGDSAPVVSVAVVVVPLESGRTYNGKSNNRGKTSDR